MAWLSIRIFEKCLRTRQIPKQSYFYGGEKSKLAQTRARMLMQTKVSMPVETVVLLSKKHVNPKAYVEIGFDAEEYYKIKGEKH